MKNWEWIILLVLVAWGLTDTIRRGFASIVREQKEMNRNLNRIAQQLGYEIQDDPLKREIWSLIQAGDKIEAIKLVRIRRGITLKEAKIYVDDVEAQTKS